MQSQQILEMSSSRRNAGTQASAILVDGIVSHILLQSSPDLNQSLSQLVHVLHFFSGRRDLASLHKSRNLLGWDLGYSEATDQVRWMPASPVAVAWSSRVPCAPAHCIVGTRRSRQTPAVWQITTVDSDHLTVVATVNFHIKLKKNKLEKFHPEDEFLQLYFSVTGRYTTICEH